MPCLGITQGGMTRRAWPSAWPPAAFKYIFSSRRYFQGLVVACHKVGIGSWRREGFGKGEGVGEAAELVAETREQRNFPPALSNGAVKALICQKHSRNVEEESRMAREHTDDDA